FALAERGAPLLCGAAAWLWVCPLVFAGRGMARRSIRVINVVSYAWCTAYAVTLLRVAWSIHASDYDNSVLYWTVVMLAAGFAALLFCLFMLRHASNQPHPKYLNVWVPALLAFGAAVMASTPLWWLATMESTRTQALDLNALVRLGLDPDPGLAFLLL